MNNNIENSNLVEPVVSAEEPELEPKNITVVVNSLSSDVALTSETLESILLCKIPVHKLDIVMLLTHDNNLEDLIEGFRKESDYNIELEYLPKLCENGLNLTPDIINKCGGDYILVVTEGTVILPNALSKIANVLAKKPVDLLLANWRIVSDFRLSAEGMKYKPFEKCLTIQNYQIPRFLRLSDPNSFVIFVLAKEFILEHARNCMFSGLKRIPSYFYLLSQVKTLHLHSIMSFWTRSGATPTNAEIADPGFCYELKKVRSQSPHLKYFINTYLVANVYKKKLHNLCNKKRTDREQIYINLKVELAGITKSKIDAARIHPSHVSAVQNIAKTSTFEEFCQLYQRSNFLRVKVYTQRRFKKHLNFKKYYTVTKKKISNQIGRAKRARVSNKRKVAKKVASLIKGDLNKYLDKAIANSPICLIGERLGEARDSGFALFQYIRQAHPDYPIYYVTTKESKDRDQVESLGNFCYFGTPEHMDYFLRAKVIICTHSRGELSPWGAKAKPYIRKYYPDYDRKKYIMLGHGITVSDVRAHFHVSNKNNASYARFICGALPEYEFLKRNLGYENDEIVYTGLARFDLLMKNSKKASEGERRKILVMPTWRRDICSPSWLEFTKYNESRFIRSEYFKRWSELLNADGLGEMLDQQNAELLFYPHPEVQQYSDYFCSRHDRVEIGTKTSHDLSGLIAEYDLLITDYSSVFFDFAYQNKPVIYYQFDRDKFFSTQYKFGYYRFEKDAFGPICTNATALLENLDEALQGVINPAFIKRRERFFPLRDSNNRKRIFELVEKEFNS